MPPSGVRPLGHSAILTYEEIVRIVRVAADCGVRKIRLTGGEPLIRKDICRLVAAIAGISGIEDISLTTNGHKLGEAAGGLAGAGLCRVNVSLDSLDPGRYRLITRGGEIRAVLEGMAAAERAGLLPVKINMVPVRGLNDDEIEAFARLTLDSPRHVRFIEYMPVGDTAFWSEERFMPTEEIRRRVERAGRLDELEARGNGPARYFRFSGAAGVIGFISPMTHHICPECNRLRLTSDGRLRPCLFSETEIDIRSALRSGASDGELGRLFRLAVEIKPRGREISGLRFMAAKKAMSRIGG
jgi:cyclic pyranopterin phosphate synthase